MADRSLEPYVPRVVLDWQRDSPDAVHRAIAGSLAFVDISGFTAMSERLSRAGKLGAEEVTDVLDSTFSRLLAVAYENDGSLLKFGGDALLLFFSGSGHQARACHAAVGMRARLREIGPIPTTAGQVRLRMSIGVHSGTFDFFLVGEEHRELVITGSAASRTVEMESAASAGEIMISADTASSIEAPTLGPSRDGGFLLRRAPPPPSLGRARRRDADRWAGIDLARMLPVAIRQAVAEGSADPEHRRVAVAFLKYSGVDEMLASQGPARVAKALEGLMRTIQQAAADHHVCFLGTDIDRNGGKVILTAGAPRSTGSDEEAMLRTARAIVDASPGLPVRIGINRGDVFAGEVGPEYRRTYTVMGDTVNLAARLMARAAAGEILASAAVVDRALTRFDAQPLEPFLVKGKKKPVTALRVGRGRGARIRQRTALPLWGRDAELAMFHQAVAKLRAGDGRVVQITGEAGIGKTRLLEELARLAGSSSAVEWFTCEPYAATSPYAGTRLLLRRLCAIAPDRDPEAAGLQIAALVERSAPQLQPWLPLLAIAAGATSGPTREVEELAEEFRPLYLRNAVSALCGAIVPQRSVLVLDDAHWMDEASVSVLRQALPELAEQHSCLVVVSRAPGDGGLRVADDDQAVRIELGPLAPDASRALALAASEDLPHPRVEALAHRAGGHPLFLLELVAAAAAGEQAGVLPETVESAVSARIDTLAPRDRTLLRHAAVIGETVDLSLLSEVLDEERPGPVTWRRLDEFVSVVDSDVVRFRQSLFRDVAYEALPFRRRRQLHRRAGEVLRSSGGAVELLSLHFHRAHEFGESWRYSRQSALRARSAWANLEAAVFLRRALEAARHVPGIDPGDVATAWQELGDVSETSGLFDDAGDAFRGARRVAPPAMQPTLMVRQGRVCERLGRYGDSLRWFSRGLRAAAALPHSDAREEAEAAALLARANTFMRQGRHAAALRDADQAAAVAEHRGDRPLLARACFILDWAHRELGRADGAHYAGLALEIYQESGDLLGQARMLNNLGIRRYVEGRWDEAIQHYSRCRDAARRAGHVIQAATAMNNIGEILSDRGQPDEAEEMFREARSVWKAARYPSGVAIATSNLGRAAARGGRFDEARTLLAEALDQFTALGDETSVVELEARIAELLLKTGEVADALELATKADRSASALGGIPLLQSMLNRIRGEAHLLRGDHVLAQECLDESLRQARRAGAQYEEAQTLTAWARLARGSGRPRWQRFERRAAAIFNRLGVARS